MDRLGILLEQPPRTLGVLAVVLLAASVAVGSGAAFTAQTANPSNSFASGTLQIVNSKNTAAVLTASNLKPGDTATGTVDIQNSGSLSASTPCRAPTSRTPTARTRCRAGST